jgi:hypothetical protein
MKASRRSFSLGLIQGGRVLTESGTLWGRPSSGVGFAGCFLGSGLINGGYYGLGWRMCYYVGIIEYVKSIKLNCLIHRKATYYTPYIYL